MYRDTGERRRSRRAGPRYRRRGRLPLVGCAGSGGLLKSIESVTVEDPTVTDRGAGVEFIGATDGAVCRLCATSHANGIAFRENATRDLAARVQARTDRRAGIDVFEGDGVRIARAVVSDNRIGVEMPESSAVRLSHVTVVRNGEGSLDPQPHRRQPRRTQPRRRRQADRRFRTG